MIGAVSYTHLDVYKRQQFGQFIARIRKEKKMTQAELAEKIHVTDKAISRWELSLIHI